jgi:type II secretory ATPase GspE/PulE/Tfp pilus assembly ATPase PilB-like protein
MTDLSQPSPDALNQANVAGNGPGADARLRLDACTWPAPPMAGYAEQLQLRPGEPCILEGLNGQATSGRLISIEPEKSELRLLVPPSRAPVPLRFSQFQRLTLTMPLRLPEGQDAQLQAPLEPFALITHAGHRIDGRSYGHVERAEGLYLFEPIDGHPSLRRSFVPRSAIAQSQVGEKLGEMLVGQRTLSEDELRAALEEQRRLREQKIGQVLLEQHVLNASELDEALQAQGRMPMIRLGEALLAMGYLNAAQLDEALEQQRAEKRLPLGEIVVRMGFATQVDIRNAMARKMGYPQVDVRRFAAEPDALQRLPLSVATRLSVLPLVLRAGRLVVAMEDPSDARLQDELEFAAQCKVLPVLADGSALRACIHDAYRKLGLGGGSEERDNVLSFDTPDASQLLATLELEQTPTAKDDERQIEQSDNSLVKLINSMILEAQNQGVSDIHIEVPPGRSKVRVRFRKDGVLRPYLELPPSYRNALIARLKIMCDLDISERRKPQDGKISFGRYVPGSKLELRLATIPTHSGCEDAVMRLLASAKPIPLEKLGLSPWNSDQLKQMSQRPYGMVLCVGPTGSGKTTTLHSVLGFINRPDRKIWTAEDPIEITQDGLRQVQVNAKIGWTFAHALRSFLRADPDVIMVGEIRDKETAQTAVESSLTGHLVLSTLHTNSAPETVTRLLDMGMDPFNFADSLLGVLAQRLVRRLCSDCKVSTPASEAEEQEWVQDWLHAFGASGEAPKAEDVLADWRQRYGSNGRLMKHHSPGCKKCDNTGFKGRAGLHELMAVTRELRHLIQTGARAEELARCALGQGMRTLRQDGIEKMLAGITSIEEVRASSNA